MALETGWKFKLQERDDTRTKRLNEILTELRALLTEVAALEASLGTAAFEDLGTSGATIPLLSTANLWALKQTIGAAEIGSSSLSFEIVGAGFSSTVTWQQGIASTAAYNASPVAGLLFYNRYHSNGSYAPMGGVAVGKENATSNNRASYLGFYTAVSGGTISEVGRFSSAGVFTCLTLQVDDANFNFDIVSSDPTITLDTGNDRIRYVRSSNTFQFTIGGSNLLTLNGSGQLVLSGASCRLDLTDRDGDDSNPWVFYNQGDKLRFFRGGSDRVTIDSGGNMDVGGEVRCDSFRIDAAPTASAATPSTHKIAVNLNGSTYYLLVSDV